MSTEELSLQERFYPNGTCFGCGPANGRGLRIKSFVEGDQVVAEWQAEPHHEAFDGVINGGIIGTLFDCHSNWAGIAAMMKATGKESAASTVTASLTITYLKPTPSTQPIQLIAATTEIDGNKIRVSAKILANDEVSATSEALFVAVGPDHPGYHRWE